MYVARSSNMHTTSLASQDTQALKNLLSDIDSAHQYSSSPSPLSSRRQPAALVINGPNINMLGIREPKLYGTQNYKALEQLCQRAAHEYGFAVCRCYQSNHEGALVDEIQAAYGLVAGIVINPGAYTHTSIALLDALQAVRIPTVEVHISNLAEREEFRQTSYVRMACIDSVIGLGLEGYRVALKKLANHLGLPPAA